MTSVSRVASEGDGEILATYREIPAPCQMVVDSTISKLRKAGIEVVLTMGGIGEPVCETPVELNRIGIILLNGMNPVAAAVEAGIEVEDYGMKTVMEYKKLVKFQELMN